MGNEVQFTTVNAFVGFMPCKFKVQDGMVLRDKNGEMFLFKDGKCQIWKTDYRQNASGQQYGSFVDYGWNVPIFLGEEYKKALDAVMDNDENANDLTLADLEKAHQQFSANKLGKDFEKHGVKFARYQSDDCGIRWGGLCIPGAKHLKRNLDAGQNARGIEVFSIDYVPEKEEKSSGWFKSFFD